MLRSRAFYDTFCEEQSIFFHYTIMISITQHLSLSFADGYNSPDPMWWLMCHIVQTFSIFNNRMKAIEMCISRFDVDTKEAFLDLYTKVDEGVIEDNLEVDKQAQEDYYANEA